LSHMTRRLRGKEVSPSRSLRFFFFLCRLPGVHLIKGGLGVAKSLSFTTARFLQDLFLSCFWPFAFGEAFSPLPWKTACSLEALFDLSSFSPVWIAFGALPSPPLIPGVVSVSRGHCPLGFHRRLWIHRVRRSSFFKLIDFRSSLDSCFLLAFLLRLCPSVRSPI